MVKSAEIFMEWLMVLQKDYFDRPTRFGRITAIIFCPVCFPVCFILYLTGVCLLIVALMMDYVFGE